LNFSKQISFKVKSDLLFLEQVLAEFAKIYEPWVSKKDWLQCQLALAEGFTNAVRHAHKNLPNEETIFIEIGLTKEEITMKIWDWGGPFDLESKLDSIKDKKDHLAGGGRGIEILQKIADQLDYFRTDNNQNCLLIVKKINEQSNSL
jgi:serine/threonine-protein kinase RsbW